MMDESLDLAIEKQQKVSQFYMNKENPQKDKPTDAVVVVEKPPPVPVQQQEPMTAQQLRVVEVSEALAPAYAKASTLELTKQEIEELTAPFPDHIIEVRPHDGLIWVPHIHISNRLNEVFKPGKWSLICRRHWMESNTMYGEYILLIKGCYVGESVGGHPYVASNPKTNYSDSLEATAAEALRRICGKRLSCGSQVWDPGYATAWCNQWRGYDANRKQYYKRTPAETLSKPAAKKPESPKEPTKAEQKAKAKKFADLLEPIKEMATQYCVDLGWILPNHEGLEDVPYSHLPKTEGQFKQFRDSLEVWAKDGVLRDPYRAAEAPPPKATIQPEQDDGDGEDDVDDEDAEWRKFPMTHGKHAGKPLADLDKKYLYGLWHNFTVETTWTNSEGKVIAVKTDKIEQAKKLRAMLDQAGEHYNFTKKD